MKFRGKLNDLIAIALIVTISVLTVACSSDKNNETGASSETTKPDQSNSGQEFEPAENGYVFEYNGVRVVMHAPAEEAIEALGEEQAYFEAESCAFDGLDKTYSYPGFDLLTYPIEDRDYISAVILMDDSVTTVEGLYIGSAEADVETLLGSEYSMETDGAYVYEKNGSKLQVIVKDGSVISIEYLALTD